MREQRQQEVRSVLQASIVTTQKQLLDALGARGMPVDQSTLSRDLAELGVRKVRGRYVLSAQPEAPPGLIDYKNVVLGFVACGPHLIVVRTAVGQAQPVALTIDARADESIAGTLAGDDTIFVATKSRKSQIVALRRLSTWFGDKRER